MKRIAVMGAVGCYDGFKLARAGHNVLLIGRPRHVEVIKRQGLRLETQTFDEHIRVAAIGGDQQLVDSARRPSASTHCRSYLWRNAPPRRRYPRSHHPP